MPWLTALALLFVPVLGGCTQPAVDTASDMAAMQEAEGASHAEGDGMAMESDDGETAREMGEMGQEEGSASDPGAMSMSSPSMTADGREIVRVTLTEYAITSTHTTFQTGVPYRLVIEDTGVISHELRVLLRGETEQTLAEMSHDHGSMEHDHAGQLLHVSGETLQPGATIERDLTFFEPGAMELACHLPGHPESGMVLDVDVVGEAVSHVVRASDISFDPEAMAGMPCHAMGTTIMGDCDASDVLRIVQEILAESESTMGEMHEGEEEDMGDGMGEPMSGGEMTGEHEAGEGEEADHSHDEGTSDEGEHGEEEGSDEHGG